VNRLARLRAKLGAMLIALLAVLAPLIVLVRPCPGRLDRLGLSNGVCSVLCELSAGKGSRKSAFSDKGEDIEPVEYVDVFPSLLRLRCRRGEGYGGGGSARSVVVSICTVEVVGVGSPSKPGDKLLNGDNNGDCSVPVGTGVSRAPADDIGCGEMAEA
jgi:hypothetical protein